MTNNNNNNTDIPKVKIPRRRFIKKFWIGLGILAGIESVFLAGNFFFPKKNKKTKTSDSLFIAGSVSKFPRNSITPFRNRKFFLSRTQDGGFLALSIKCTHLGCNIIWEENNNRFICPCHSSWFNTEGDVMHPPASRPLSVHPIIIKNGNVLVNTQVIEKRNTIEDTKKVYIDKRG